MGTLGSFLEVIGGLAIVVLVIKGIYWYATKSQRNEELEKRALYIFRLAGSNGIETNAAPYVFRVGQPKALQLLTNLEDKGSIFRHTEAGITTYYLKPRNV